VLYSIELMYLYCKEEGHQMSLPW